MIRRNDPAARWREVSMWRAGLLAVGICLVPGAIQSAWAQTASGGLGVVHAVSYREVPNPLSLSITLFDDSNLDLRIRDQMVASLERAKYSLGDDPLFELELSSGVRSGSFSAANPSLGRVSSNRDVERFQFQMNIWSSSLDSVLGGRHSDRERRTLSSFEIQATLRERSLGEVVWEGRAIVEAERSQVEPYVPRMVESLVQSLGRTVRDGTFPVP
jgi:hypothetical protein